MKSLDKVVAGRSRRESNSGRALAPRGFWYRLHELILLEK